MYYCPFLSVAVSSHYTGDVIVIYVILISYFIHIRVHNSMVQTQQCYRLSKVKSQHTRYIENKTPQPYIVTYNEDCYCCFYR